MKKLSIITVALSLVIALAIPARAWELHQGPCMDIKIDMSKDKVETSAMKLAILTKMGVLLMSKIDESCTGVNLISKQNFNPWMLESEYLIGVTIHALRVRPQANEVILGVNGLPVFVFTYHREYGKLCCEGVRP
jgi:hypothetical protein